jgi:peroxiredoxin
VVDLHASKEFQALDIELLSISPDAVDAWRTEGAELGIVTPMLSDAEPRNAVAALYGVLRWKMAMDEPGHTFVLVDQQGRIAWLRDYGAPENGGLMYVTPADIVEEIRTSSAA